MMLVMAVSLLPGLGTTALAESTGGYADLQLRNNAGTTSKKLYDRQFIKVGTHDALIQTDNTSLSVLKSGEYVAYYINGTLYLNGDMSRMCIDMTNAQQDEDGTVRIQVENNVTLSEDNGFIRTGNGRKLRIDIPAGNTLTLNADNKYWQRSSAVYASNNGDIILTGGGDLRINCKGNATSKKNYMVRGIEAGSVTIKADYSGNAPGVYINMTNDTDNTKSDKLCGILADQLTVQDDGYLKIEVTGRKLEKGESRENTAIKANRMELLGSASVDILSHKNVISDVILTGTGEVLKMDIEGGRFHITNEGNIKRYDDETSQRLNDHPFFNIYVENADSGAAVNLAGVGDEGLLIDSYSLVVGNWASEWKPTNEPNWNWAIGKTPRTAFTPTLADGVYQGNRRIGGKIINGTHSTYTWGSMEYVSPDNGVWTVKYADSQTYSDTAQNYETTLNDTYVVAKDWDGKGRLPGSANITAPNDEKSTFLYWYDALHPEDGTWSARTWDYDITKDRLLVPVYGLMEDEPALSELKTYNQYSYKELTFTAKDSFASAPLPCYIVKGLPKQGVGIETVADLQSDTKRFNSGQKFFADKDASHSSGSSARIPEGTYRLAYYTNGRWYFSEEFEFKLPLAKPLVKPESQAFQSPGKVPVQIHAERGDVSYRYWDYSTNDWSTSWDSYTDTFDADVTVDRDTRIQIKLRQENTVWGTPWETLSEVRYGVCPSISPTVKFKDTVLAGPGETASDRYSYYGSMLLTAEVPEGLEMYYGIDETPYMDHMGVLHGTKAENGEIPVSSGPESARYSFRFCKTFTVEDRTYRKICGEYTTFQLKKLETLTAPKVTFCENGVELQPDENNVVYFHDKMTAELSGQGPDWPLNAKARYRKNGGIYFNDYTEPLVYTQEGSLSVYTKATLADGRTEDSETLVYTIKQYPGSVKRELKVKRNIEVCDMDGNPYTPASTSAGNKTYEINVGKQIRVVAPAKLSDGRVFKNWSVVPKSAPVVFDDKNSPTTAFTMPNMETSLEVEANYASPPAEIEYSTCVRLFPDDPIGKSMELYTNAFGEWRHLTYTWYEGNAAAGTPLGKNDFFEPGKTYTAWATVTTSEGVLFRADSKARVKNDFDVTLCDIGEEYLTRAEDRKSISFDLHLLTKPELTMELQPGSALPTAEQVTAFLPEGYSVKTLTWADDAAKVPDNAADVTIRKLEITSVDGSYQLAGRSVWINGEEFTGGETSYYGGTLTLENIEVPVRSSGVELTGAVKSCNPKNAVTLQLIEQGRSEAAYETTIDADTGSDGNPVMQNFRFENVAPGTYDLVVRKDAHLVYTVKNIEVGASAIDLTKHANAGIRTITLIAGNMNGDSNVNADDLNVVWNAANFNRPTKDAANKLTDINGDGNVNADDLNIIWNALNFNKSVSSCTVNFKEE